MNEGAATNAPLRRNLGVATAALIASGGTLVCCVLPAAMVALGAGASLAGLVSAVPQLIWLSSHKAVVFGSAFALLVISGILLWRAHGLPCPTDPHLARACTRLRRASVGLWCVALACASLGALFAFVLPL
jgi:microsomal dipeptidase-like Zn-dependent dipeptidase